MLSELSVNEVKSNVIGHPPSSTPCHIAFFEKLIGDAVNSGGIYYFCYGTLQHGRWEFIPLPNDVIGEEVVSAVQLYSSSS